jgi:hypothetical protein
MEQRPLNSTPVTQLVPEEVDHTLMHGTGDITIACSIRRYPDRCVPDPNLGLVRKAIYTLTHFFGFCCVTDQTQRRRWD